MHFNSDKEIKNLLAKTDECADERVKICALFSFMPPCAQITLDALWSQIDFANSLWQIPAQMMKTARPHTVFLSQSVKIC